MRKQFKKALSMVLSAAMVLTLGSGVQVKAENAEQACDAYLAFCNNWNSDESSYYYWAPGDENNLTASNDSADGDGHYKLSLSNTTTTAGVVFMAAEIKGLKAAMNDDAAYAALKVTNIKLYADGEEVAIDASKVVCGHNDQKGNYRVTFFDTGIDALGDVVNTLSWENLTVEFDLEGTGWGAKSTPEPTQEPTDEPSQPGQTPGAGSTSGAGTTSGAGSTSGEATQAPSTQAPPSQEPTGDSYIDKELWAKKGLHAYVSYQTATWDYRNAYAPGAVGKKETYDYIQASGAEINAEEAKVTDVYMDKDNVEYTVAIEGIDLSGAAEGFKMLSVATDLDSTVYAGATLKDATIKFDGQEIPMDGDLVKKSDDDFYNFMAINSWDPDRDTNGGDVHYPLQAANEDGEFDMPTESIEITFTVTGIGKALEDIANGTYVDPETGEPIGGGDQPGQPGSQPSTQPSTQPSVQPSVKPSTAPQVTTVGLAKGKSFTAGNFKYKVTKSSYYSC